MIDWQSEKNEVLFNPRTPADIKTCLLSNLKLLSSLKSHVCFATSGSSGKLKWTALSKSGILASAQAVNLHLQCDQKDIWLNPLPEFHVGGIGIIARGHLSKALVIPCHFPSAKWNPEYFCKQLEQTKATLTSLVPTQVFDLAFMGFKPPSSLRAVIVGGGVLNEKVYFSAVKLGWKLLPSYGLTECSSQVATARYGSWSLSDYPLLAPLKHVNLTTNEEGFLKIRSEALLTAYIENSPEGVMLKDPKIEGWLTTEDKATFEGRQIKQVNRGIHFVKIGGESVDLQRLERILEEEKLSLQIPTDVALVALENDRLGFVIHLAIAGFLNEEIKNLIDRYHQRVFPFERIIHIQSVKEIPRSPLKKVLITDLKELIFKSL